MNYRMDRFTVANLHVGKYVHSLRLYNEATGETLNLSFENRAQLVAFRVTVNQLLQITPS